MRYVIEIAYKGTAYAGWQIQPNAPSIQATLDAALGMVLRREVFTLGAGRTDAGVHAAQMFAHFDLEEELPSDFLYRLNAILPKDIAVSQVWLPAKPDFNARFDAIQRAYTYRIARWKDPFWEDWTVLETCALDLAAMEAAAAILPQHKDFASFCKSGGNQKTTLCHLTKAEWETHPRRWEFHISANRFLRGMVRAIVGSLIWVGKGKLTPDAFEEMIHTKDRRLAGPNIAAKGLTLESVAYPGGMLLPWLAAESDPKAPIGSV